MAITLPDTRQLADEVLEALRLRALHACELGFTQADVANILGVAPETVCRWWVAYSNGGLEAIPHERTGRPQGSGAALSDEQATGIVHTRRTPWKQAVVKWVDWSIQATETVAATAA